MSALAPYSVAPLPAHPGKLHVVTCVTNYARYRSRPRLYRQFAHHVANSGAILWTIECVLGTRPFEVTEPGNPNHIQVRCSDEIWHKENLFNLAIARLPHDAQYIATVDADLHFARTDWAHETVQMLQHHPVVQMFSTISNLGPNEELLGGARPSFVEAWQRGAPIDAGGAIVRKGQQFHPRADKAGIGYSSTFGPPGGAWAYRREALDALGGLIDFCVLGSADFFMALGLIGMAQHRLPTGYSPGLKGAILSWQANAQRAIKHDIGVVTGSVLHHWHGAFKHRRYDTREQILSRYQFEPRTDLKPNSQGVLHLVDDGTGRTLRLRDEIRAYFHVRNEDSIDTL